MFDTCSMVCCLAAGDACGWIKSRSFERYDHPTAWLDSLVWSWAGVMHNFVGSIGTHLQPTEFRMLADPKPIFEFDMCKPGSIKPQPTKSVEFVAREAGVCNAVCVWFALQLDELESLDTGPQYNATADRTHWPQTCYVLPAGVLLSLLLSLSRSR